MKERIFLVVAFLSTFLSTKKILVSYPPRRSVLPVLPCYFSASFLNCAVKQFACYPALLLYFFSFFLSCFLFLLLLGQLFSSPLVFSSFHFISIKSELPGQDTIFVNIKNKDLDYMRNFTNSKKRQQKECRCATQRFQKAKQVGYAQNAKSLLLFDLFVQIVHFSFSSKVFRLLSP